VRRAAAAVCAQLDEGEQHSGRREDEAEAAGALADAPPPTSPSAPSRAGAGGDADDADAAGVPAIGVVAVPPTLAALEAAERRDGSSFGTGMANGDAPDAPPPLPVRSLIASPLRAQMEAAEAERQDALREKVRKLRGRAKKVRQRIAATAGGLRLEHLETLWGGGGSTQGSKRMLRLLADLQQLTTQPQSDGAETVAWELCRLLEAGRDRDLHTLRAWLGSRPLDLSAAAFSLAAGCSLLACPLLVVVVVVVVVVVRWPARCSPRDATDRDSPPQAPKAASSRSLPSPRAAPTPPPTPPSPSAQPPRLAAATPRCRHRGPSALRRTPRRCGRCLPHARCRKTAPTSC
jgi:hypothetical protein